MTCKLISQHNRLVLDYPELGKPFTITFEKTRYQVNKSQLKNELLAKAIGIKKNKLPHVCDISAGFGQDAYLLYCLGCKVDLVERSPTIATLLKNALEQTDCKMNLYIGEAKEYLLNLEKTKNFPDVIYFDPIFPQKTKTALAQKHARLLRAIVGDDEDSQEVFLAALKAVTQRVVVKRPLHANSIVEVPKPDVVFKGKTIRFDVYLKL